MPADLSTEFAPFLEADERLLWASEPDRSVMLKTLGRSKRMRSFPVFFVGLFGAVAWLNREQLAQVQYIGLLQAPGAFVALIPMAGVAALIIYFNRRKARSYVDSLAYGMTTKRVLILQRGVDFTSYSAEDVRQAQMEERLGAGDYHDIIWGSRLLRGYRTGRATPAIAVERSRVGFKALPDGPVVMAQLKSWLSRQ